MRGVIHNDEGIESSAIFLGNPSGILAEISVLRDGLILTCRLGVNRLVDELGAEVVI